MKKLNTYILETLKDNAFIKSLSTKTDLGSYVDYLNLMLDNDDSKEILKKAFFDTDDDNYEFNGKMRNISVADLHPTQSEIDVDKSLGYPFKGKNEATSSMKMFFSPVAKMPFPLITFNGFWIVDGHHRWSQVYSFNPDAKMECFDITVKKGGKLNEQDMLKIVQGLLAAKRAEDSKGKIPRSTVDGANLFKMSEAEVKDTVIRYCNKNIDVANIICKAAINDEDPEALADYLCNNLMMLRKDNERYARRGNNRGIMPQTDRGGDNPDDSSTAQPNYKGSVLNKIKTARVDKEVINK